MATPASNAPIAAVKARFFIYWKCFFAVVSALAIASNTLVGLEFHYNYKWIAAGLSSALFAWLAWRELWLPLVHRLGIYTDAFIILPMAWLSSAGLESPAMAWSMLAFVPINYLFQGRERLAVNLIYLALLLGLIGLYYLQPQLFSTYTPEQQAADWLFNLPLIALFLMFSLIRFERAYEAERQANQQHADAMQRLSQTDPLTGLHNRQKLTEVLQASLQQFRETGSPTALLFLDVDAFKHFNDYYGHSQGDVCLRRIAREIQTSLKRPETDFAFRFGGEEFLIVLRNTDLGGALHVARRLRERIEALAIPHRRSGVAEHVTASIGVATWQSGDRSLDDLIVRADRAQYDAKRAGRNRVQAA